MTTTTQIKNLKQHAAQMRTQVDPEGMAALTLQVYQRGLDEWQPIVAAPAGENGEYQIISGHRRRMARLFAFALEDWASEHPEQDVTVEVARTLIAALSEKLGSVEAAAEALLQKYGQREILFVPFSGDQKAEVLALQAANFGREEADMPGIAHSFRQALESGASPEEIARNAGQSVHYVLNHLALTDIPAELAQRIAAGELPMSVARTVAELPEPKRTGMAIFLLANDPGALTAKEIKGCAATLKKWNGIQVGLTFAQQTHRNIARALSRLWSQVVEAYPEDAYAAATMLIYRGLHEEPWAGAEKASLWFQALGGDVYYQDGSIHWPAVVEHLLVELSCDTCPLNQLPRQPLRSDLSGGQGGVLGMPCRVGEEAARCIGPDGIIGGQFLDLAGRDGTRNPAPNLLKTASMTRFMLSSGAIVADAPGPVVEALADFGREIGSAYQMLDDVIDGEADARAGAGGEAVPVDRACDCLDRCMDQLRRFCPGGGASLMLGYTRWIFQPVIGRARQSLRLQAAGRQNS